MEVYDFNAVVRIDEKVFKASRSDYIRMKFEALVQSPDHLPTSLVAEKDDGTVVGFVMGQLYIGDYGIADDKATLDTIGVDPDYQHKGIGQQLINEFIDHLRSLRIQKVDTLVDANTELMNFFSANGFIPSKTINMERSL
jgi:ribosomal protein S18 acetylase RimI-like enzyme